MRYFYQNFVLERDLLEWLALLGLHIIFNLSSWLERKWYLLLTLKLNGSMKLWWVQHSSLAGRDSGLDSLLKTWFRHICQRVFFHPVGEDEPIVIKDGCPDGSPGSDVTLSSQLSPISTRCECRTSISSLTRFDIGLMLATEFDDDSRVSPTLLSSTSIN